MDFNSGAGQINSIVEEETYSSIFNDSVPPSLFLDEASSLVPHGAHFGSYLMDQHAPNLPVEHQPIVLDDASSLVPQVAHFGSYLMDQDPPILLVNHQSIVLEGSSSPVPQGSVQALGEPSSLVVQGSAQDAYFVSKQVHMRMQPPALPVEHQPDIELEPNPLVLPGSPPCAVDIAGISQNVLKRKANRNESSRKWRKKDKENNEALKFRVEEVQKDLDEANNEHKSSLEEEKLCIERVQNAKANVKELEQTISILEANVTKQQNLLKLYRSNPSVGQLMVGSNWLEYECLKNEYAVLSSNANRDGWMSGEMHRGDLLKKLEEEVKVLKIEIHVLSDTSLTASGQHT